MDNLCYRASGDKCKNKILITSLTSAAVLIQDNNSSI